MSRFPALEPPPYDNLQCELLPADLEAGKPLKGEVAPLPHTPCILQYGHSILRESWQVAGKGQKTSEKCGEIEKWTYCPCCGKKPIMTHCDKPLCPVCYEIWTKKRAKMISARLLSVVDAWQARGKKMMVSHYTLSIPSSYYALFKTEKGYRQIRKDAYKLLKRSGLVGGVLVVHSHRQEGESWRYSPHFHILGAGYIQSQTAWAKGWVLKKIGRRENPYGTARYILSHAGIFQTHDKEGMRRTVNSICWFGLFSTAWVRTTISHEWEEMLCECGARLYQDAEFTTEAWRLIRCYSYRLKPLPPPIQMTLGVLVAEA